MSDWGDIYLGQENNWHLVLNMPLSKLYTNSMMSSCGCFSYHAWCRITLLIIDSLVNARGTWRRSSPPEELAHAPSQFRVTTTIDVCHRLSQRATFTNVFVNRFIAIISLKSYPRERNRVTAMSRRSARGSTQSLLNSR